MDYSPKDAKAAAREAFEGVWAAVTSPFTPDGRLDEVALRSNVRHLVDVLEIDGIFCTGAMGEFWALTREEKTRSMDIVIDEARGGCLVIAHTGDHSADETIRLTRHAQDAGADFAIMLTPYYPACTDDGIFAWFQYVCSQVDIGVWMFDGPIGNYRMAPVLADRISDLDNICGMKQAWPIEEHDAYHALLDDKIVVSQPLEKNWLRLLRDYGQQVHMSSPAPYLFQTAGSLTMKAYTDLARHGRWDEAEQVSQSLAPVRKVAEKWLSEIPREKGTVPIPYIKAWSGLLGMASGPVRAPLVDVSADEERDLRDDLAAVGLL